MDSGQDPDMLSGWVGMIARRDFPCVVLPCVPDMAGKAVPNTAAAPVPGDGFRSLPVMIRGGAPGATEGARGSMAYLQVNVSVTFVSRLTAGCHGRKLEPWRNALWIHSGFLRSWV